MLTKYIQTLGRVQQLWIIPDVQVSLKLNVRQLTYEVRSKKDGALRAALGGNNHGPETPLSDVNPVTLGGEARSLAKIPSKATQFAFAYPCLRADDGLAEVGEGQRAFLWHGGFVYMDETRKILRVNALRPTDALLMGTVARGTYRNLVLSPGRPLPGAVADKFRDKLHESRVAVLLGLSGAAPVGWLGMEQAIDLPMLAPHGAFVALPPDDGPAVCFAVLCKSEKCCDSEAWDAPTEATEPERPHSVGSKVPQMLKGLQVSKLLADTVALDHLCHSLFLECPHRAPLGIARADFNALYSVLVRTLGIENPDEPDEVCPVCPFPCPSSLCVLSSAPQYICAATRFQQRARRSSRMFIPSRN